MTNSELTWAFQSDQLIIYLHMLLARLRNALWTPPEADEPAHKQLSMPTKLARGHTRALEGAARIVAAEDARRLHATQQADRSHEQMECRHSLTVEQDGEPRRDT